MIESGIGREGTGTGEGGRNIRGILRGKGKRGMMLKGGGGVVLVVRVRVGLEEVLGKGKGGARDSPLLLVEVRRGRGREGWVRVGWDKSPGGGGEELWV
jgi:hypothetical protein